MNKEHESYQSLLEELQELYPEAGLSFGYHGNLGKGWGTYDDLDWKFFTKVWNSQDHFYKNCHQFPIGRTPEKEAKSPVTFRAKVHLRSHLIKWLEEKVVPDYGTPCTRTTYKPYPITF